MNDSLEYLFYSSSIFDRFVDTLNKKSIPWTKTQEMINNASIVLITEDDIEEYWDEIDDLYDELAIEDQRLEESGSNNPDDISTAGIHIALKNNGQTIAQVNPDILNRILDVLSPDEFAEFVDIIAKSVEDPNDTPICKFQNLK
ncbi:MAG: hypothetical protein GY781_10370 [Gammaproteobacteria bacterium]|nr:hypothetical protein [Gammaproteobacteria bacterium]